MIGWLARILKFHQAHRTLDVGSKRLQQTGSLSDKSDPRDIGFTITGATMPLLKNASVEPWVSMVKSQGRANSCVAHAGGLIYETELRKFKNVDFDVSEEQLYYDGRDLGGLLPNDNGMYPRDVLRVMLNKGVAPEKLCPYNPANINTPPTLLARSFQQFFKIKAFYNMTSIDAVKQELQSGHPVMFSTPMFETFQVAWQDVALPAATDRPNGSHEIAGIAFDDDHENVDGTKGALLIQNSWGTSWGFAGRVWMPYTWFTQPLPGSSSPIVFYSVRL